MVVLITGGSGSGKSEYAENKLLELRNAWLEKHPDFNNHKVGEGLDYENKWKDSHTEEMEHPASFYIATMLPFDEESKLRVKRHHAMRRKKQFQTLECYTDLKKLFPGKSHKECPCFILLECVSNLVANERYQETGCGEEGQALVDYVVEEVVHCMKRSLHMVIVTNEVSSDGVRYDSETIHYQEVLGAVNQRLAQLSQEVWEIVCGIPIQIK